jgi:hypothetical protein
MKTLTEVALQMASRGIFTRREAACWLKAQGDRLNALLKRAVGSGEVLRICRGIYCLNNRYLQNPVNPLELAQRLYGPSYISLESALSIHGWIPEAVFAVTSVSLERSRDFESPLGLFRYIRIPQKTFYAGVQRIEMDDHGSYLAASPLKALADYIYVHHCAWDSASPVRESLRVDEESLSGLTSEDFDPLMTNYASERVQRFLRGFRKDLGL